MSTMTSTLKQDLPERKKVKKKMSKAQMQLAIIKKKQCDAKALAIVEQLLEPNVDPEWLLQNLGYINKSHMEDVIEERAIIKLCGYVLCDKALTAVITQRYYISTKKNKVYDVTRRKNFCSSPCYGACNYLLEQMLTSPLWLREKEEIPMFRFLVATDELQRSTPGEEIHVGGIDLPLNLDKKEELVEPDLAPQHSEGVSQSMSSESYMDSNTKDNSTMSTIKNIKRVTFSMNHDENCSEDTHEHAEETSSSVNIMPQQNINEHDVTKTIDITSLNQDSKQHEEENDTKLNEIDDDKVHRRTELESNKAVAKQNHKDNSHNDMDRTKEPVKNKHTKCKKSKQKTPKLEQSNEFFTLAMRIEQNVKEWMTEDTLCLLSGEENIKNKLLENVTQHDKYLQLCKKLNKLQLEDEKDDRVDLTKSTLKPLPHLNALEEEGKKMELKVRAFYKGSVIIQPSTSITEDTEQKDSNPILPLTDAHAPTALRRRILLDKLNRILPDLLRALANSRPTQYIQSSERTALIKALVNTFALSAANITFKTAEWTLVGLIIIKMLSIIDPPLKNLLATRQASMYISMILMSYKLDSNYLDRFVIELTNNPKIFSTD